MKKFIVFVGMLLCAGFVFASDLQKALKETADQFSSSLKERSVVAIIGIYSQSSELSDFMMDELTLQFVRLRRITIADRANLEAIKKEMNFQLSGEVGDESIQQLGAKIGAETVIQGGLKQLGKSSSYILTIRALNVKTAAITDMYRVNVVLDDIERSMLGEKVVFKTSKKSNAVVGIRNRKSQMSVTSIGLQNLVFGLGSYRAGHYGDGALLTISHAIWWIFMPTGVSLILAAGDMFYDVRVLREGWINDENGQIKEQNMMSKAHSLNAAGISLLSVGIIAEVFAIIYGSVRPIYYNRSSNILADANNSGFKFDLVSTAKGNITPQISYIHRY